MYQQSFSPPPQHPFSPVPSIASPPPLVGLGAGPSIGGVGPGHGPGAVGADPYRAAPIPVNSRSPYAFSPPPQPPLQGQGGFSPMPASSSGRYLPAQGQGQGQAMAQTQGYHRSGPNRYGHGHGLSNGNGNGYGGGGGGSPLPVPPQQTPQQKYKGTLAPGTIIKVGDAAVRIERYLSEGGYAHVYLTSSDAPLYPPRRSGAGAGADGQEKKGRWGEKGYTQHCLKRIAFEDEKVWVDVRKEIEVMKALPVNPHLTQFLASAHSRLPNGGYEVFILMEFCSGGGIIDLLNKRLRDRLKEIEILNIFTDVCEAVAAMHALKRPLLHRDLKIENVLSIPSGLPPSPARPTPLSFKLCDFGSTTFPMSHPPTNKVEAEALAMDLNKHTTLQYRSPEMVEPMLGWAVGLPSDVWALGVLLYKLCYYTTPFEEHGSLAIVNAKYTFPQYPVYSPHLQHLIAAMLVDHPARRPTVFEVLRRAHDMSGTRPEVDYPSPSRSFASPPPQPIPPSKGGSTNLLDFTSPTTSAPPAPIPQPDIASTVQPQRRGRPTRDPSQKSISTMGGVSPMPQPPQAPAMTPASLQTQTQAQMADHAPAPKLQVTGGPPAQGKSPSLDAFGMPNIASDGTSANGPRSAGAGAGSGFGDAFGAPSKQSGVDAFGAPSQGKVVAGSSPSKSGFDESFGVSPNTSVSGLAQRFGGGLPKPTPSFTDSYNGKPALRSSVASAGKTDASGSAPSAADKMAGLSIHPDVTRTTSPKPQSALPAQAAGPVSFETRFPSIESLDAASPVSSSNANTTRQESAHDLISPISPANERERPALQAKASMMGHLTGDLAPTHQTTPRAGGAPLARSTQVTGTAFKADASSMLSPGMSGGQPGLGQREGYFGARSGSSAAASPSPDDDLITGDEYQALSGSPVKTPDAAPQRPTIVTTASGGGAGSATGVEDDSSDDVAEPESATGLGRRPASPSKHATSGAAPGAGPAPSRSPAPRSSIADRRAAFEGGAGAGARDASPRQLSPTKRTSLAPSAQAQAAERDGGPGAGLAEKGRLAQLSSSSSGSGRAPPQSMFVPSPSSGRLSTSPRDEPLSAGVAVPSSTSTSENARPGHQRKGSIAEMAARYESPSLDNIGETRSPAKDKYQDQGRQASVGGGGARPAVAPKPKSAASTSSARREDVAAGGQTKKAPPGVGSKPQALRKATGDVQAQPGSAIAERTPASSKVPPAIAAKPRPTLDGPRTSKHGDMPAVVGYSKTSSGRAFPIYKAPPASSEGDAAGSGPSTGATEAGGTSSMGIPGTGAGAGASGMGTSPGSASSGSSPDKKQSVNSLIARWNQGNQGSQGGGAEKGAPKGRGGRI